MEIKIINNNNQMVVSSREIAENFDKEHKDILEGIRKLMAENSAVKNIIFESSYVSDRGQIYPMFLLTRDGFSLLVMGFTGKKALKWKLKYIDAFNRMEKKISQCKLLSPTEQLEVQLKALKEQDEKIDKVNEKVDNLKENMPLFGVESDELQSLVKKYGVKFLGGYGSKAYTNNSLRGKVYADMQRELKRNFGVKSYKAIKRCQLSIAEEIIKNYQLPLVLEDEIKAINNQVEMKV